MKRFDSNNEKGFAALISTVIISAILLAVAASASRAAFWARFDLLARENKKISAALAEACVNAALLDWAEGKNISLPKRVVVDDSKECEISEINNMANGDREINTRANWKNSYTNLKITAKLDKDSGEITIGDWREF